MERAASDKPLTPEVIRQAMRHRKAGIMGEERCAKHAVLVPLVRMEDGQWAVLFEKRAATLRRQASEICFPGGRIEAEDASEWDTARRETGEELQIPLDEIEYVGTLDILVAHSQQIIYPFVGRIDHSGPIRPNPAEVESVIVIELERLLAATPAYYEVPVRVEPGEDYPYHLIPNGKQYPWRTGTAPHYFYEMDGTVIWGLTARILFSFLETIRGIERSGHW